MNIIDKIERERLKDDVPEFTVGDTLAVHARIIEEGRERIQIFTGYVIARAGSGARETVTLRRESYGRGVEKVFPIHSPRVAKIELKRRGRVRQAKLYYLRDRRGKKARVKEDKR